MLQLRGFIGTADKVKTCEFHPVQPWLVFADKSDCVRVWDWSTQQVLHSCQLGGADEEAALEAAVNEVNERDPSFATNPSAAQQPSRLSTGKVRQVRFLDADVAYWQAASQHYMVSGTATTPPKASKVHALEGTRLLVIVCDNKVLLYDIGTRRSFEVTRNHLEGRSPTCVAYLLWGGPHAPGGPPEAGQLMTSPVLAIGCSDGMVRLVHLATLRVIGKLAGSTKGSITSLLAIPSKAGLKPLGSQPAVPAAAAGATGAGRPSAGLPAAAAGATGAGRPSAGLPAAAAAAAASFTGGPAAGVTGAVSYQASRDFLVGGDSTGAMFVWEPFSFALAGPESEMAPRIARTAHNGEIWSFCLVPGSEDPVRTEPRLYSSAADHRIACWDGTTFNELYRMKVDSKTPITSLGYSHRYFNTSGAHALLTTNNNSLVMAMYTLRAMPPEQALRQCLDVNGMVPPGTKKVPKAYIVATNPLRPNLAAVGVNTGLAFLTFDRMFALPVAPMPLKDLGEAHLSPGRAEPMEPVHVCYVAHIGDSLWHVACAPSQQDVHGATQQVPTVLSCERIGDAAGAVGRAIMGCSPTGDYVSACWPAARKYVVYYRNAAGTWQQVDTGSAVNLVWHSHHNVYAVLVEPPPPPRAVTNKKSKKKDPRVAAAEAQAHAAAVAAGTHVSILEVDGLRAAVRCAKVALGGDVPAGLHGGGLLGVSYQRSSNTGVELSGEEASAVMQFYSWSGLHKVGPELPDPALVSWEPSLRYVALAYLRHVQVFRARPAFESLGSLPVAGVNAAVWGLKQLYMATPLQLLLAFVSASEGHGPSLLEDVDEGPDTSTLTVITLASISGSSATSSLRDDSSPAAATTSTTTTVLAPTSTTTTTSSSSSTTTSSDTSLPAPQPRPPGPVALLGPRRGNLWLVNCYGQPMVMSLQHPGIRSRCLAAMGDLLGATQVAAVGLSPAQHGLIASFLHLMGGVPGAHLALMGLSGLSLEMEADLCMATGQWRRAAACCEALMNGADENGAAVGAPIARSAATAGTGTELLGSAPGAAAAEAGTAPGGAAQVETALAAEAEAAAAAAAEQVAEGKKQQQMWSLMGFGGLFVDNFQAPEDPKKAKRAKHKSSDPHTKGIVDWGAPLSADWSFPPPPGSAAAARRSLALGIHSRADAAAEHAARARSALPPPRAAVALTLRLVAESQAAGILDVTRVAAQLLLQHPGQLTPPQLARLAARMARAGMHQEIKGLVEGSVRSGSHQGQAVGFVAAALSGDLEALQAALQQSGTDALASLQAATYRLATAYADERRWNEALQRSSYQMATHPTTSYAYFAVNPTA